MKTTRDLHVHRTEPLPSPDALEREIPISEAAARTVTESRDAIRRILRREDDRMLMVVGPCSIHDEQSALEYAGRLRDAAERLSDRLFLVMRVYFEKPRTTLGWKGLLYDPHLDGSFDISDGLRRARSLLGAINELGVPAATEFLEPIVPQYLAGLISWAAIGARTTESQTHRQMASGLSMPVGFKNSTDGNAKVAVDAMVAAQSPHAFLGIDRDGQASVVHTVGNPDGHIILRGGTGGPNYDAASVTAVQAQLEAAGLLPRVMVDCSHANSGKDHTRQAAAFADVMGQRLRGDRGLVGLMLESHLFAGAQRPDDPELRYGVSITDACIGWDETVRLLDDAAHSLATEAVGTP